jgi:hypothetical protein
VVLTFVGAAGAAGTITCTVAAVVCDTRLSWGWVGDGLTEKLSCNVIAVGTFTLSCMVVLAPGLRPPGTVCVHAHPTRVYPPPRPLWPCSTATQEAVVLVTVGVPGEYLTCTPEVAAVPWFVICNVSVNGAFTAAVDGPLRATERSGAPPAASAGLELAATTTATAPALKSSRRGPRAIPVSNFITLLPLR